MVLVKIPESKKPIRWPDPYTISALLRGANAESLDKATD